MKFDEGYINIVYRSGRISVRVCPWNYWEDSSICLSIYGNLNVKRYVDILGNVMLSSLSIIKVYWWLSSDPEDAREICISVKDIVFRFTIVLVAKERALISAKYSALCSLYQ